MLNLRTQNEALLLKFLHKFLNKKDIPWVNLVWKSYCREGRIKESLRNASFWWKDVLKLIDKFRGMTVVDIRNGKTYRLWDDQWNNFVPRLQYLKMFSFAKKKTSLLVKLKA